jgi:hypothetical protein
MGARLAAAPRRRRGAPSGPLHWLHASALQATGSAGRAGRAGPALPTAETVAVLPFTARDLAESTAAVLLQRAGAPLALLMVEDDVGAGPNAIWNALAGRLDATFMVYLAQDVFPGRSWLAVAAATLQKQPQSGLFAFNDGKWFGELASFGMVRLDWLRGIYGGGLFFAGYRRHYGDTELTLVAAAQRALAYHPHALLVEVDHGKDARPVDPADRALFHERRRMGFDGRVSDAALLGKFG